MIPDIRHRTASKLAQLIMLVVGLYVVSLSHVAAQNDAQEAIRTSGGESFGESLIPAAAPAPSPIESAVSDAIAALQQSQIQKAIEEALAAMQEGIARGQQDGRMMESEGIEAFRDSVDALSRATENVDVKQEFIEAARQVDFNPAVRQIVQDVRRNIAAQEARNEVDRLALSILAQVATASEVSLATIDVNPAVQEMLQGIDINGVVTQMLNDMRRDLNVTLSEARKHELAFQGGGSSGERTD